MAVDILDVGFDTGEDLAIDDDDEDRTGCASKNSSTESEEDWDSSRMPPREPRNPPEV